MWSSSPALPPETPRTPRRGQWLAVLAFWALPVLFASAHSPWIGELPLGGYLPLHTLLEFFSVVVNFLAFFVLWHAAAPGRPGNMIWLACALFAAGWFDFTHALSYKGMPDLVTPAGPEKAIAFWLAGRTVIALGLCLSAWTPPERLQGNTPRRLLLVGTALVTITVHYLVLRHQELLPRTFIDGQGLTPLKVGWEWTIVALCALAAGRFWHLAGRSRGFPATALFVASAIFGLAELFFINAGVKTVSFWR